VQQRDPLSRVARNVEVDDLRFREVGARETMAVQADAVGGAPLASFDRGQSMHLGKRGNARIIEMPLGKTKSGQLGYALRESVVFGAPTPGRIWQDPAGCDAKKPERGA
jgi:hypothetical protein